MKTDQKPKTAKFRVHTQGGFQDIRATSPDEARRAFKDIYPSAVVTKVKLVKEGADV